ncbi:adenylate/guanylate cyclase domain-containing protein [Lichenibacterium dinghuense]|uniref:adenylate/guanylate cyclase domain-containing protein n=1 Tax=Lichenibacterium dinghuense TaxID=2895977 RepID=UPI001F1BA350|nr:CHASE3 domain-containing protein [Lichenibacterium sp. 6Y81]
MADGPPRRARPSLPRSGAALAAGFVLLGAVLMASVLVSTRRQGDDALLRRALEVEVDLGNLRSALLDAEVGQRGYLLTGDADFLGPYRAASDRLGAALARLGAATRASPEQAALVAEIRTLAEDKQAEMARTLALQDAGRLDEALRLVRDKTGVALMDGIRERIGAMDAAQQRAVEERGREVRRANAATTATAVVALVLMAAVALAALAEVRRRARLARFLPAAVADRIADGDRALSAGRTAPATVAFVDIRGFTALAEDLSPQAISALLTTFRGAVSEAAHRHGGLIDKFIGDGALAVFGALDGGGGSHGGSAAAALRFADELRAALAGLAPKGEALRFGIGLHHGEVFCGVVGGAERREFTVLGDVVNVASRIEAANKAFGTEVLASEAVLAAAGADRAGWREVSREPLRGHRGAVALFARWRGAPVR